MKCRLCGKSVHEISGWLARVNPKGVDGIWECRPHCDAKLSEQEAVQGAVLGNMRAQGEGK